MNKVILMGRLTKDPEVRYSQGEQSTAIARYTIAVDRRFKRDGDDQTADFIGCVAFGKAAEFAEKYFKKGTKIAVTGRIQTGSYTNKDGQKVYTTDVVVEDQEFAESKKDGNGQATPAQQGGYAPQQTAPGGYPGAAAMPQQGGYPPQQAAGYPPMQGGYPGAAPMPQQGGYPPQQAGGYPPMQGGYPGAMPQQAQGGYFTPPQADGFMNIPDGIEEELPFN